MVTVFTIFWERAEILEVILLAMDPLSLPLWGTTLHYNTEGATAQGSSQPFSLHFTEGRIAFVSILPLFSTVTRSIFFTISIVSLVGRWPRAFRPLFTAS